MSIINIVINKTFEYLEVPMPTFMAISLTLTNAELAMKMLSLILASLYTIWKWRKDYLDRIKKREKDNDQPEL